MNEKALYPELTKAFRLVGGYARKTHDAYYADNRGALTTKDDSTQVKRPTEPGPPDYICLFPPMFGMAVEVKYAATNFNFNQIKPEQRLWLDTHESQSYLWLGMGIAMNRGDYPRKTWLVPWPSWKKVETFIKSLDLAGLPYTPHQTVLRNVADAPLVLKDYELTYDSKRQCWVLTTDNVYGR